MDDLEDLIIKYHQTISEAGKHLCLGPIAALHNFTVG